MLSVQQKMQARKRKLGLAGKRLILTQFFLRAKKNNWDIGLHLDQTLAQNCNLGLTMKAASQVEQSSKLTGLGQEEPLDL